MWLDFFICGACRNKGPIALVTQRADFGHWDLSKLDFDFPNVHVKDRDSAVSASAYHVKLIELKLDPEEHDSSIRWSYLAMHNE